MVLWRVLGGSFYFGGYFDDFLYISYRDFFTFSACFYFSTSSVDRGRLEHIDMHTSSTSDFSSTDCFCQLAGVDSASGAEEEVLEIVPSPDVGT